MEFKMAEFKMAAIIKLSWEWMSLSQIELVWVRFRVEWECFWVNLREDNKVYESKIAVSESNMAVLWLNHQGDSEFNEWSLPCASSWEQNLGKCEWSFFVQILRWLNPRWPEFMIQDGCHDQVEWEWMSLSQIELVCVKSEWSESVFGEPMARVSDSSIWAVSEFKMAEFKMAAIITAESDWISLRQSFVQKLLNPRW